MKFPLPKKLAHYFRSQPQASSQDRGGKQSHSLPKTHTNGSPIQPAFFCLRAQSVLPLWLPPSGGVTLTSVYACQMLGAPLSYSWDCSAPGRRTLFQRLSLLVLLPTSLLSGDISGGSIWDCVEAGRQPVLCQGLHTLLMFPDVQEQGLRHSSLHPHSQAWPLWQLVPGLHPRSRVTASCGA